MSLRLRKQLLTSSVMVVQSSFCSEKKMGKAGDSAMSVAACRTRYSGEAAELALRAAAKQMSRKVLVALAGSSAFLSWHKTALITMAASFSWIKLNYIIPIHFTIYTSPWFFNIPHFIPLPLWSWASRYSFQQSLPSPTSCAAGYSASEVNLWISA